MKSVSAIIGLVAVLSSLGCVSRHPDTVLAQSPLLRVLYRGSFWEAKRAGARLLKQQAEFRYDTSLKDAVSVLGKPDKEFRDKQTLDVYWKTAGGPLWLCYREGKLIKRAMLHPPHWRGTNQEMAHRWNKVKKTKDWVRF